MERRYLAAASLPAGLPSGAVAQVRAAAIHTAERLGVVGPVANLSPHSLRALARTLHAGLGTLRRKPLPNLTALDRRELIALIARLRSPGKRGRA